MSKKNSVIDNVMTGNDGEFKRVYHYMMTSTGGAVKCGHVRSNLKIRAVSTVLFNEFFGHASNESWGKNGFMGGALDKQGNGITVDQINQNDAW